MDSHTYAEAANCGSLRGADVPGAVIRERLSPERGLTNATGPRRRNVSQKYTWKATQPGQQQEAIVVGLALCGTSLGGFWSLVYKKTPNVPRSESVIGLSYLQ